MKAALRRVLALPLPGRAAQKAAWPDDLPGRSDPLEEENYGPAAVLLALCPARFPADFSIPLIRRSDGMPHHAGQISLPGGVCHAGEDWQDCALREAEEEIGLSPACVDVLGPLTPVPVSVSRYRIHPIVGWVAEPPPFVPLAAEVVEILSADPDTLSREGPRGFVHRSRSERVFDAPAYLVADSRGQEARVWGATAIILAEFLALWREARQTP